MIYLYGYLCVGIAILLPAIRNYVQTEKKETETLRAFLEALHPERKKFSYRFLYYIVTPVLASICLIAFWPVELYIKIRGLFPEKEKIDSVKNHEFAVTRADLLEHLTIQQIEQREMISDPLNAVPALPFGYLHNVWQQFLADQEGPRELWSFSAMRQSNWGEQQIRSGYVVVKDGVPGKFMVTVCE